MNITEMFSHKDLAQIDGKGISPKDIEKQLERFRSGFPLLNISAPAVIENGILKLSLNESEDFIRKYEESDIEVMKFVPASGAATRMFNSLYAFLEQFDGSHELAAQLLREEREVGKFFADLDEFAFFSDLEGLILDRHGITSKEALKSNRHQFIVESLLFESGMNYANLPKGLLKFHKYGDYEKTAAQEHLAESLDYSVKDEKTQVHFTISPAQRQAFEEHIENSLEKLESTVEISVTFSEQFPNTDTIAATTSFEPFRDEKGELLFRPSGHGALLSNLNELTADLIFIKNIDNVVPEHLRTETSKHKKILAGIVLTYQERIFNFLRMGKEGHPIQEQGVKLLKELGIRGDFTENEVINLLNRPIRVCGMVKNEGELGGGPFWVRGDERDSLQIVESAQVNKDDKEQLRIFGSGTHFNPVDIVCGIKNFEGKKFDLLSFRDEESGFISEKSYNGETLKALELPGLWNGGMANWNTIFVEVPLITFNPVKTITDLLKPAHR